MSEKIAMGLYAVVTPQPRRTWNQATVSVQRRFRLAAEKIVSSLSADDLGGKLQDLCQELRLDQLRRMRDGTAGKG